MRMLSKHVLYRHFFEELTLGHFPIFHWVHHFDRIWFAFFTDMQIRLKKPAFEYGAENTLMQRFDATIIGCVDLHIPRDGKNCEWVNFKLEQIWARVPEVWFKTGDGCLSLERFLQTSNCLSLTHKISQSLKYLIEISPGIDLDKPAKGPTCGMFKLHTETVVNSSYKMHANE